MRLPIFLLLLGMCCVSSAAEPNSETLGRCPHGHTSLKDLPYEHVSDYIPHYLPTIVVTCTTCGFTHTQDLEDWGTWSRRASSPESFKRPLSPIILSFPTAPANALQGSLFYRQSLDAQHALVAESVSYDTSESFEVVQRKIANWVAERGLTFKVTTTRYRPSKATDPRARDTMQWGDSLDPKSITLTFEHAQNRCYVYFSNRAWEKSPQPEGEPAPTRSVIPGLEPPVEAR